MTFALKLRGASDCPGRLGLRIYRIGVGARVAAYPCSRAEQARMVYGFTGVEDAV